jgi:hypothetical protein
MIEIGENLSNLIMVIAGMGFFAWVMVTAFRSM